MMLRPMPRRSLHWLAIVMVIVALGTSWDTSAAQQTSPQTAEASRQQLLRGRVSVIKHDCGGCHGGGANPAADGWLAGAKTLPSGEPLPDETFKIGPFKTWARNLTPDNTTGLGRFTERQIFNALRYGLRPGETPDVDITSSTPGQGNFPVNPRYLAIPMPWPAWRHMPDQELWDIAAYLKRGLKPVKHKVPDSEGPPDFWASDYTPEKIGVYPSVPYPTRNER